MTGDFRAESTDPAFSEKSYRAPEKSRNHRKHLRQRPR